jgi:hypothetical protein
MTAKAAIFARHRLLIWILVAAGFATFAGANAHLIYVAVGSQPDCVEHSKSLGGDGFEYRAAKPAC